MNIKNSLLYKFIMILWVLKIRDEKCECVCIHRVGKEDYSLSEPQLLVWKHKELFSNMQIHAVFFDISTKIFSNYWCFENRLDYLHEHKVKGFKNHLFSF